LRHLRGKAFNRKVRQLAGVFTFHRISFLRYAGKGITFVQQECFVVDSDGLQAQAAHNAEHHTEHKQQASAIVQG
jgi:hypothetical protein